MASKIKYLSETMKAEIEDMDLEALVQSIAKNERKRRKVKDDLKLYAEACRDTANAFEGAIELALECIQAKETAAGLAPPSPLPVVEFPKRPVALPEKEKNPKVLSMKGTKQPKMRKAS